MSKLHPLQEAELLLQKRRDEFRRITDDEVRAAIDVARAFCRPSEDLLALALEEILRLRNPAPCTGGLMTGPYYFEEHPDFAGVFEVKGPGLDGERFHRIVIGLVKTDADVQAQALNAAHAQGVKAEEDRVVMVLTEIVNGLSEPQAAALKQALRCLTSPTEPAPAAAVCWPYTGRRPHAAATGEVCPRCGLIVPPAAPSSAPSASSAVKGS